MEIQQTANNILQDRMASYSAYVLLNRAIPRYEDGLKPVHRRILYSMHKHKTHNFAKSANVAGRIMMIHPHGSAYGSMVGMVQTDRHQHPLLEGKGNFGQYTSSDLQPAADRYSEVRLSPIAKTMLQNFDKNVVDFEPNYDGTQLVPEVLPVKYPAILTQAQKGIGVGFSSSTPSYNLKEVCQATIDKIDGKDIYLVPDFATGGYIEDNDEQFKSILETGSGSVNLRAKYEVNDNEITITEIPYGVKREKIIDDIIKGVKSGLFTDIKAVNDLTGLKGMNISIVLKKQADPELNLALLFKHTSLESKYSSNMNILIDDKLKVVGADYIIEKWIEWRKECVKRGITFDIDKLAKKVHLYEGLEVILLDIDNAIDIIRKTSADNVVKVITETFKIDEEQANEVLKMPLRNINKDYLQSKIDEIESLKEELEKLKQYRDSDKKQLTIVKKGLRDIIKEFGQDRRTQITKFELNQSTKKAIQTKQLNDIDKDVDEIILTKQGFLYKNYKQANIKLSPGDEIVSTINNSNDSHYIYVIFKQASEAVGISVSDINESNSRSLGQHINSFNNDYSEEEPILIVDKDKESEVVFIFDTGKAIVFDSFAYDAKRKLLRNAKHASTLLYAKQFENDFDLKLTLDKKRSKILNINTKDIAHKKSRNGTGASISTYNIQKIEEA